MKMTQLSDTTLKITISLNDLEERGMELADFLMPQEKTEDFFYTILEELDLPDNFKLSGMLSFRVTPKKDKVDIFVTKSELGDNFNMMDLSDFDPTQLSPEDFFKNLEASMRQAGDTEALDRLEEAERLDAAAGEEASEAPVEPLDYIHYVLAFEDLPAVVAFAKQVDYPIEASELYKYQGSYQLTILIDVANKAYSYPEQIYSRILEHAQESGRTRAYLREHATLLREGYVIQELAALAGV